MFSSQTIPELIEDLRTHKVTSRALVEHALDRVADQAGEGQRAFMTVWSERARSIADHIDRHELWRDEGLALCGIPVSIKDVFDVAGEITRAGSIARDEQPVAAADATAVARLRASGAILIGRTTMSEFAFSGIGLNHHFGTPLNPWDRATGRIPGGSSSGSAVAVADRMGMASLASDTGGSVRAPAALCGVTGFKPTASRVPLDGVFPRSYSLDTVGPIARSVSCCALLDAVLSGAGSRRLSPLPLSVDDIRIGVIEGEPLQDLSPEVANAFSSTLSLLSRKGARLSSIELPEIERIRRLTSAGGISPPEAFAIHRDLVATRPDLIDPIFLARLRKGSQVRACDYIDALRQRQSIMSDVHARIRSFDVVVMPTCPIIAPAIVDVLQPEAFEATSSLILRNCNLANFLDRPALTLPIHEEGSAPVGMMLMGHRGCDEDLLRWALVVEKMIGDRKP